MPLIAEIYNSKIIVKYDSNQAPKMSEMVVFKNSELLGEVIATGKESCQIEIYGSNFALKVGDNVEFTGKLFSINFGVDLLGSVLDSFGRVLYKIDSNQENVANKKWDFIPTVQIGEEVWAGKKLGYIQENENFKFWLLSPDLSSAKFFVKDIAAGNYDRFDIVAILEDLEAREFPIKIEQEFPIKKIRKYAQKLPYKKVCITKQRFIDTLFPIVLGSTVTICGNATAGKTWLAQNIAQFGNFEIVIYVFTGDRIREIHDLIRKLRLSKDIQLSQWIIVDGYKNTTNNPQKAIYSALCLAQYYRDMGYDVALFVDSLSFVEDTDLLDKFYKTAGQVRTLSEEEGSITTIATVCDFQDISSQEIIQKCRNLSQVFLHLDSTLAFEKQYPAIDILGSFSLVNDVFDTIITRDTQDTIQFTKDKKVLREILFKNSQYEELSDADDEILIKKMAKLLQNGFLLQNTLENTQDYCSLEKTSILLRILIDIYENWQDRLQSLENKDQVLLDFFSQNYKELSELFSLDVSEIASKMSEFAERIRNSF